MMPLVDRLRGCASGGLRFRKSGLGLWLTALAVLLPAPAMAQALPEYERQPGVAGNITSVGSDTLANVMAYWSQEFKTLYPQVKFQLQASGSSTAPPALTEGTATIGPMSRALKPSEVREFVHRHGYPPTVLKVAMDAIAIFVQRQNPLPGLTLAQVDALFSQTRFCGAPATLTHWEQLQPEGQGMRAPIRLFGRNSVSGTYSMFKGMALCEGDFRPVVNEQPSSASVVMSVAANAAGIGYAAYGYQTAGVRAVPVGPDAESLIELTTDSVSDETYPFTRYLYLMVNKAPDKPLPVLEQEFLCYVLSAQGQRQVKRDGYFPVGTEALLDQRRLLGCARR